MTDKTNPTPTVEMLRANWEWGGEIWLDPALFDQALEEVKTAAKAEALEEVAAKMHDKFTASWIRGQANIIRNGPRPLGGVWGKEGNTA